MIVEAHPHEKYFKWGKAVLEILAFLALVAYVYETRRTNDLTEISQRPWVWVRMPDKFNLKVDEQITLDIQFVNYGKIPAISKTNVFLYHSQFPDTQTVRNGQQSPPPPFSVIVAPGEVTKPLFTTAISRDKLSKKDYDTILAGGATVIAAGRIVYTDLQGNQYESAFCVHRLETGAVANCPASELNYMK